MSDGVDSYASVPACSTMMAGWRETLRGMAFPIHCDHMGHVNNRWYAHFFDDASMSLWSTIGLSERALQEKFDTSAVIAHTGIDYLHELVASDQFVVESAFTRLGGKSLTLKSRLYHVDTRVECARQTMVAVFFDIESRQSVRIPDSIRVLIEPELVSDDVDN